MIKDRNIDPNAAIQLSKIGGLNPSGAQDYFVDLNRVESNEGTTWGSAFKTIAEAITASNASIGLAGNRWWAKRNRIYVCGDGIDEDLTVLPEKTDIIGVGYDIHPFPRVVGNHTIAVAKKGCRFIDMGFYTSGTGDLFVIPASSHGIAFLGCHMHPGTTSTKALEITSCAHVRIEDCIITVGNGDRTNIFGIGISLEGTTFHDCFIGRNKIDGTIGIKCAAGLTAHGGMIYENFIRSTGLWIDDDSDDFMVINNRGITAVDTATSTAGYDFNLALAAGNIQTGSGGETDTVPFTLIAEG